MIRRHQIEGLASDDAFPGSICGFVLNFRDTGHTYFLHIRDFLRMSHCINKKSYNEKDIQNHSPPLIRQRLRRTTYDYDICGLIKQLQTKYNHEGDIA